MKHSPANYLPAQQSAQQSAPAAATDPVQEPAQQSATAAATETSSESTEVVSEVVSEIVSEVTTDVDSEVGAGVGFGNDSELTLEEDKSGEGESFTFEGIEYVLDTEDNIVYDDELSQVGKWTGDTIEFDNATQSKLHRVRKLASKND